MNLLKFNLFLLVICGITIGCEQSVRRTYVLENHTDYSIELILYYNARLENAIVLEGNGSKWETYYEESLATNVEASRALGADSAIIIYNDLKLKYYSIGNSSKRNILENHSYIIENDELYRYIFTKEDYENADEIGQ